MIVQDILCWKHELKTIWYDNKLVNDDKLKDQENEAYEMLKSMF